MIRLILLSNLFLLAMCGKKSESTERALDSVERHATFTDSVIYEQVNKEAVAIGNSIQLLDSMYHARKDISTWNEQFVHVSAQSNKRYKQQSGDELCDEFLYIKVNRETQHGIVNGKYFYELLPNSSQHKLVDVRGHSIEFIPTQRFAIGVSDAEMGLTGCSIFTPIVFVDPSSNFKGLVRLIKNKFDKSDYPYFELKNDESAEDTIETVDVIENGYLVKIKRVNQMDEGKLVVRINNSKGIFFAEIVESSNAQQ